MFCICCLSFIDGILSALCCNYFGSMLEAGAKKIALKKIAQYLPSTIYYQQEFKTFGETGLPRLYPYLLCKLKLCAVPSTYSTY